jgi:ComF family protein
MLRTLAVSLRQLVLPAHCAACGRPSDPLARLPLCDGCGRAMARLMEMPHCPRCGRGAGPYTFDLGGCAACRKESLRYDAVVRVGSYQEPLRSLILRYKYQRRMELGTIMGRWLAERLAAAPWADLVQVIVPVPLHWSRRFSRGFNQAEGLARELATSDLPAGGTGRRVAARRMLRVRPTPHQTRLSAKDRAENVRGAFQVRGRSGDVRGKHILLVDDVITSGSTAGECARTLRRAGAAAVYVAVAAVAGHDEAGPW